MKKLTQEQFISAAKNIHTYDYSQAVYINNKTKLIIICKTHGPFLQSPNHHINRKHGCPQCGKLKKYKSNTQEFIKKAKLIHKDRYDYSLVNYISARTNVVIICKTHGPFNQIPNNHLSGNNCPKCVFYCERLVGDILKENHIKFKPQHKINNYRVDYYIEALNTIIEYNGAQHYQPVYFDKLNSQANFIKQQKRDQAVRLYCKKNNIKLIEIDGRIYKSKENIRRLLNEKMDNGEWLKNKN